MRVFRASLVTALLASACGSVTPAANGDAGADAPVGVDAPITADGGDSGTSEPRLAEACAAVAKAVCDKRVACSNKVDPAGAGIERVFGSMAECLVRQALFCATAYRAPGSGHSLASEQECVDAFAKYSCADFFASDAPPACQPAGSRVNGAACAFDTQCKSGFCTGEKNALCGTCAAAPAVGASCAASDCARGQVCEPATTTCVAFGGVGDACQSNETCGYGLVCASGSGSGRTCQTAASMLGATCGGQTPVCDAVEGLFCGGAMGSKKCVAITYVDDGMPCGVLSQDSFAACKAGACYTAKGTAGVGEMGTCKANAKDGAACDTVTGPACELPARCILGNGTSGTCRVPTGACG